MTDEEEFDGFEDEFEDEGLDEATDMDADAGLEDYLDESEDQEDEWDEEEFDPNELAAKPKKKLNSNTIIIGLGVVLALGMFVMQVTKSGNKGGESTVVDQPVKGIGMAGSRDGVIFKGAAKEKDQKISAPKQDESDSGLLGNLDSAEDLPKYQPRRNLPAEVDNPPQPKPFSQQAQAPAAFPEAETGAGQKQATEEDPLTPLPQLAGKTKKVIEEEAPLPSFPAEGSGKETVMAPIMKASSKDVLKKAAPGTEANTSQADMSVVLATLESITGRLDSFETRLDEMSKQINNRSGATASSSEIASLKKTVAKLENKLEKTRSATTTAKQTSSNTRPETGGSSKAVTRTPPKPAPKWELRAAQPGRAWVAKAGSEEMQMIDVGDSLTGIGKISSISYDNGIWIIQGTQGKITQ